MLGEANWHIFSCLGKLLLFDVKTGGLHELDEAGLEAAIAYRDRMSVAAQERRDRMSVATQEHAARMPVAAQERSGFVKIPAPHDNGSVATTAERLKEPAGSAIRSTLRGYGEPIGFTTHEQELPTQSHAESVVEAYRELENMVARGLLSSPFEEDEEYAPDGETVVKALCLHVAHDCNLRCKYCFGKTGNFGMTRELMPLEVAKAAIDFLLEKSGQRRNLNVDFFGGEPLLNFDVVKAAIDYCDERAEDLGKRVDFTITTNCLLLDGEVASFLNERDILVVLSIDGRRDVNDRMRIMPGGQGSYEHVAQNLVNFIQTKDPHSYYVRSTYTRHNLDFASDVLHLADLGAKSISAEPVISSGDREYSIRQEDIGVIEAEYENLTRLFVERHREGRGFLFYHFNIDLDGGPCLKRRLSGCGAGTDYLAVSPGGDIYPCHQFVGKPEFKMGDVFRGDIDSEISAKFRDAHVYNKDGCASCWARFICSGGCHAAAYGSSGDILIPDKVACALQKKRIECALAAQAMLKDVDPKI